jgi:hypothetical protein
MAEMSRYYNLPWKVAALSYRTIHSIVSHRYLRSLTDRTDL